MRVLIAVEEEPFTSAIVEFVGKHAWQPGTMFRVVAAVQPQYVGDEVTAMYGLELTSQLLDDRIKDGEKTVSEAKARLATKLPAAMPIETSVVVDAAHHAILQIAEQWKADMIVMGSHGRGGWGRLLLGSVSLSVLSHAKCSVVIVKIPKPAETEQETGSKKAAKRVAQPSWGSV